LQFLVFLLIQGFFIPLQNENLYLSLAIVAFVLLGVGYFLRRKSRKFENKTKPFLEIKSVIFPSK
jgi:hypothetical protein